MSDSLKPNGWLPADSLRWMIREVRAGECMRRATARRARVAISTEMQPTLRSHTPRRIQARDRAVTTRQPDRGRDVAPPLPPEALDQAPDQMRPHILQLYPANASPLPGDRDARGSKRARPRQARHEPGHQPLRLIVWVCGRRSVENTAPSPFRGVHACTGRCKHLKRRVARTGNSEQRRSRESPPCCHHASRASDERAVSPAVLHNDPRSGRKTSQWARSCSGCGATANCLR